MAADPSIKQVEVTANTLNVRQLPSLDGAVVDSLKRGERVAAPRQPVDGWFFVETDSGISGYVAAEYVRRVEAAAPAVGGAESSGGAPPP